MPRLLSSLSRNVRCTASFNQSINQSFKPKFVAHFHSGFAPASKLSRQSLTCQLSSINNKSFSTLLSKQSNNQSNNQSNDQSNDQSSSSKRTFFIAAPVAAALAALLIDQSEKQVYCESIPAPISSINHSMHQTIAKTEASLMNAMDYDIEIASWWRRFAAWLIDNSIVSVMFQITASLCPAGQYEQIAVTLIALLCNAGYEIGAMVMTDGATAGKWVFGLRVQRDDWKPMDVLTATKFWTVKLVNFILGADVLYGLLDLSGDRKCLHNWASDTVVVRQVKREEARSRTYAIA